MASSSLVTIIVLSWNRIAEVVQCLDCVHALDHANVHVVVVDNASVDGSAEIIKSRFPTVELIECTTNLGYTGGVNLGLEAARSKDAEYVWLLNDDVAIEADTLTRLVEHADARPDIGLFSPVIALDAGYRTLQFAGAWIDWANVALRDTRRVSIGEPWYADDERDTVLTGTAMFLRMDVYRAIGPLDERYFAYFEDTDYSIRAARRGFRNQLVSDVFVFHRTHHDRNTRPDHYFYFMVRNKLLFFKLNGGRRLGVAGFRKWLIVALEWIGICRDRDQQANLDACIAGMWDAIKGRYGPRWPDTSPRWFRAIFASHPYLMLHILRAEARPMLRRITQVMMSRGG